MIEQLLHLAAHHAVHYLSENHSKSDSQDVISRKRSHDSSITSKVVAIIVDKLGVEPYEVTEDASFVNDLGADSLDSVELIMEFEKEFGITVNDNEAERVQTVGDAISLIQSHMR